MAEKIINYYKIKAFIDPRIIDTIILNIFLKGNYQPLCVCDKSMIKSVKEEKIIVFSNTDHIDSLEIYQLENMENTMKVMKYKLLVTSFMKNSHLSIFYFLTIWFRAPKSMFLPVNWW